MGKLIFIILVLVSKVSYSATQSPRWEVRTAPIAILWSWYTLDLSYFLNSNWAVGPSYINYGNKSEHGNMFLPVFDGTALGAHAIWSESFIADALYVSVHHYQEDYTSRPHAYLGHYEVTGKKTSIDFGKRWIPHQQVSGMIGIGYEFYSRVNTAFPDSGPTVVTEQNSGFLHIEFKLGYFF